MTADMTRVFLIGGAVAFCFWLATSSELDAVDYALVLFPAYTAVLIGCLARI
jgi:hypothetical protein